MNLTANHKETFRIHMHVQIDFIFFFEFVNVKFEICLLGHLQTVTVQFIRKRQV